MFSPIFKDIDTCSLLGMPFREAPPGSEFTSCFLVALATLVLFSKEFSVNFSPSAYPLRTDCVLMSPFRRNPVSMHVENVSSAGFYGSLEQGT